MIRNTRDKCTTGVYKWNYTGTCKISVKFFAIKCGKLYRVFRFCMLWQRKSGCFKRKYSMFVRILLTLPDSFPPSSSWHQMLRKNVNVALVDYLCQGYNALNTLYRTCVTWEFWFTNEISKKTIRKCITNRADWTSSSVLHCNVTVAAWRRKLHATLTRLYNVLGNWREIKTGFGRNILIRTDNLLILFDISMRNN